MTQRAGHEIRTVHPFAFLVLMTPFGVSSGFATVTLGYLLVHAGVSVELVAGVVASSLLPQTWKFLWAPVVDSTLRLRQWYLIGVVLTAAGIAASGSIRATAGGLALIGLLVGLTSFASTLCSMSIEALLPHHVDHAIKGRVSGWLQAGNLGGNGIGGGAALWLAQHLSSPALAALLTGLACLPCAIPLALLHEPQRHFDPVPASGAPDGTVPAPDAPRLLLARLTAVLRSLWRMACTPAGFLGLLVMVLPTGSGAAMNLWSSVADGWHASADVVALVNGAVGGVVSMVGCLLAGPVCDRMDRRHAYILFGLMQAAVCALMALGPRTESAFAVFTLVYSLVNGFCYTGYSAVAFDSVTRHGAATQFNAFTSLANAPILYMDLIEGWAYTHHGASAMLWSEVVAGVFGVLVFALASRAVARRLAARGPADPPGGAVLPGGEP